MDTPENHPEPLNTDIGAVHFSGVLKTADNAIRINGPLTMGGGVVHGGGPLWISGRTATS
ncbi:hypothetical protein ABIB35_003111 [Arthrobacter sp. UYP6]|uniref:hypothetical protein n=1 Tax=Arthrobacter sp. UYP6 TaxID=1756378 RepID=UPI00339A42C6